MKDQEKIKNTYTKEMLIKEIARTTKRDLRIVRTVYNVLEEKIMEILSSANNDTDISIRLFEGIALDSVYVPEKTKINNLTGETIITLSKIKPKANITRNYQEKLTSYNK